MGLELVEVIIAVEDHFGLDLDDSAVARVYTVGDLRNLVVAILEEGRSRRTFLHMAAFHRVRRALMKVFFCSRSALRPEARLEDLLPPARRAAWSRLSTELGLRLPGLRRPPSVQMGLRLAWGVPTVGGLLSSASPDGRWQHALAGAVIGLLAGGIVSSATLRHAIYIPPECETLADLVDTVVRLEQGRLGRPHAAPTPELVLEAIIAIASEHLGVEREHIHAESLWVEDLGAG